MVASKEMNEYWRISSNGQYKKGQDVDAIVGRTPIAIPTVAVSNSSIENNNHRDPMVPQVKSVETTSTQTGNLLTELFQIKKVENPLTGQGIKDIINLVPGMTIEDLNSVGGKFPALFYNSGDTTAITNVNTFSYTPFWQKKIEVDGSIEGFRGDLRIKIEPSQGSMVTSAQSIAANKDLFLDSVQWLKDYKLASDKRVEEGRVERAKSFLKIGKIDPTDPAYNEYLAKQVGIEKEVEESMPFSGGIKIVQNIGKITNIVAQEVNLISKGPDNAKTELHHIATDKSKKFDFKNHPAFKETGIDVSKDIDNLVALAGHRGRHTNAYHQEVQRRLDAVYERFGGTDKLESAVRNELNNMKEELLDGALNPYGK